MFTRRQARPAAPLRYRYLPPAVPPLHRFERNVTSQAGEDGVIAHCLEVIGDRTRWCVEFGAADGRHASNTYTLIRDHGYAAVLIERDPGLFAQLQRTYADRPDVVVLNEAVAWQGSSRLDAVLARTPIPNEFDLLVVDIDGNDYHVWNAVEDYRPKLVVIEFNGTIPNEIDFVQAPDMDVSQGSSFMALVQLADVKGYRPVHATAVNAFFVRSDCYPRFGLGDVDPRSLRSDLSLVTWLFQTYDGRLTVAGNNRIKSHDVPIRTARLQQVPRSLREFPPSYSPLQRVAWRAWRASRQPRAFLAQHTRFASRSRGHRAGRN